MDKYLFYAITNAAFRIEPLSEKYKKAVEKEYHTTSKENIYKYAKERKILPFVAKLLCDLELDSDYWRETVVFYTERNGKVIRALDKVFKAFEKNGVKRCFVAQNFGALLASGMDISLFASGDVDMCGQYSERKLIEKSLSELGFTQKDRYCGKRLISSDFANNDLLPEGFEIGIEYDTLSRIKLPEPIKAESFVDFNKLWKYADTAILLPPVDALTYICLVHISLHSFSRAPDIRLYIDIENCIKAKPNMDVVLTFAEKDKTLVRVITALQLTKKLFDIELPICKFEVTDRIKKRVDKLQRLVFDDNKHELIYEPSKINTLKIELAYYDNCKGIQQMLFPDKKWKDEVYGGHGMIESVKHILRIIH